MKISHLSITWYSSNPTGTVGFSDTKGSAISMPLNGEAVEKIAAVLYAQLNEQKAAMAADLAKLETPALIGYDADKTIDNDIPF